MLLYFIQNIIPNEGNHCKTPMDSRFQSMYGKNINLPCNPFSMEEEVHLFRYLDVGVPSDPQSTCTLFQTEMYDFPYFIFTFVPFPSTSVDN